MKFWKSKSEELERQDWGNLRKYAAANKILIEQNASENKIVLMGDSITEFWESSFFVGKPYINRGISGQTTPQMLVRFREDVIDLKPKLVVILGGINDIAENTGYIPLTSTFGNIASMAELARANNIKVVLSSVLPAYDFVWKPRMEPADKVITLNAMLKAYAINTALFMSIILRPWWMKEKD